MLANNSTDSLATTADINTNGIVKYNFPSIIIIGILIVFENSLVCLAFTFSRKLRKRQANILVCSQAAADLIMGLVFVPWLLVEKYTGRSYHSGYIVMYVLFVSLLNLLSLALDRYLALIKPLMHHLVMDVHRTKKMLLGIWIIPFFIAILPLSWHHAPMYITVLAYKIYLFIFWGVMLILCSSMIFMYIRIYRTAAKTIRLRQKRMNAVGTVKENRIKTTRKELRIAHLFGLLLFFFILAYLPILYINLKLLLGLKQGKDTRVFRQLSLYCLITNSMVNPILCLLLKKDYQLQIKRWICFEWVTERWGDDSPGSQVSCRTGVEDMETTDSGSEARRKRLLAVAHRPKSIPKGYRNSADLKVRFEQDSVALLGKTPKNGLQNGVEINGNETRSTLMGKQHGVKTTREDGGACNSPEEGARSGLKKDDQRSNGQDQTMTSQQSFTLRLPDEEGVHKCKNEADVKEKLLCSCSTKHCNNDDMCVDLELGDNPGLETEEDPRPILRK